MRTFLKNLERFRAATLLNLLGLTVAYAVALVIILQVNAEYSVDTKYPDSDRIYRLELSDLETWQSSEWKIFMSRPQIEIAKNVSPDIEAVAFKGSSSDAWLPCYLKVVGRPIEEGGFRCGVTGIDPQFTDLFGMQLVEGSPLDGDKTKVLIPQSMAHERFSGISAVGQKLELAGGFSPLKEMIIGGVYRDFPLWSTFQNEVYRNLGEENVGEWGNCNYIVFVKLRTGADTARVAAALTHALNEAHRAVERSTTATFRLQPLANVYFATDSITFSSQRTGNKTKADLFLLVALLVVAIGAINYANFATALVPWRIRGINTRKVYGASNGRLRRGLLAEALALSLGAYVLAALGVCALNSLGSVSFVPSKVVPTDYLELIGCGALVAVGVGLLAGLFPALYSTSIPPAVALKGSFGLSPRGKVLRTALVGFQFIVSVVLMVAAVAMNLQYRYAQNRDLGFSRQAILNVAGTATLDKAKPVLFDALKKLPEVVEITYSSEALIGAQHSNYGRRFRGEMISYGLTQVASNFVSFYGLHVIEGSDFTSADDLKRLESEAIFNLTAKKAFNLAVGDSIGGARVVGFVEDFHTESLHTPIGPFALMNYGTTAGSPFMTLHLKVTTDDWQGLMARINQICRTIDPNYMGMIKMLDSRIAELYASDERATTMVTWFGGAAILVSLFGVFGLVHFEIAARRKEIGLRKINGATIGSVLLIFARRFMYLVVGACVVAIPVAWWVVQRLLEPFAYRAPIGWWVYGLAGVLVLLVVVVTVVLQTLEAARANPIKYIRNE